MPRRFQFATQSLKTGIKCCDPQCASINHRRVKKNRTRQDSGTRMELYYTKQGQMKIKQKFHLKNGKCVYGVIQEDLK